ncbi:nodulin-related protein 1 [Abeliophyllum distichum]|uniref:Nodulin-related protein 1 n=1 Tax=Abeliophyllum distichum TaxID=126358 RepID=A0ABD1U2S1_9LAMI
MDLFSKLSGNDEKPTADRPQDTADPPKPSNSDLMSRAKVLAEAAKTGKYDNPGVAGAAADIIDAGEKYGKLDENKGVGQYIEKAEDYLRKYDASHSTTTTAKPDDKSTTGTAAPKPDKNTESESGGGGYMKMAGDFLKK